MACTLLSDKTAVTIAQTGKICKGIAKKAAAGAEKSALRL